MEILALLIWLLVFAVVWLLPLYFVCQWAERNKKDHLMVGLVGFLTSWVIGLIVALLLPELDEKTLAARTVKAAREPMGDTAIVLCGLGVMTLGLLGAMAFVAWGI